MLWPPAHARCVPCVPACALTADADLDVVVVRSYADSRLHVHSLSTGTLLRTLPFGDPGRRSGTDSDALAPWDHCGICVTTRRTLLGVRWHGGEKRLAEVSLEDGRVLRMLGPALAGGASYLHCGFDVVAVSEPGVDRVTLLSLADGAVVTTLGGNGPRSARFDSDGVLDRPTGVRVTPDGSGVFVVDSHHHRVCLFSCGTGACVGVLPAEYYPTDVVVCDGGASVIVVGVTDYGVMAKVCVATGDLVPWRRDVPVVRSLPNVLGIAVVAGGGGGGGVGGSGGSGGSGAGGTVDGRLVVLDGRLGETLHQFIVYHG